MGRVSCNWILTYSLESWVCNVYTQLWLIRTHEMTREKLIMINPLKWLWVTISNAICHMLPTAPSSTTTIFDELFHIVLCRSHRIRAHSSSLFASIVHTRRISHRLSHRHNSEMSLGSMTQLIDANNKPNHSNTPHRPTKSNDFVTQLLCLSLRVDNWLFSRNYMLSYIIQQRELWRY